MTAGAGIPLRRWLDECRDWIDGELDRRVPRESEHPERIHRAMRYALFGGGKRLRPALCRLVCESLGGQVDDAAPPAAALELVHTYSLVHDDLPCMDDDDLRRGRATVHVEFDEATAVLVGDALLTLAFELLGEVGGEAGAKLVVGLARAAGSRGMVGGQALDLSLAPGGASANIQDLVDMHERKTGALFASACELGALAAGAPPAVCDEAAGYGLALGRAFQATDDLLDVTGDAATLGKTPGKDEALERPTLVAALGLEEARAGAAALAQAAREAASRLGWGADHAAQGFVDFVLSRRA